MTDLPAGGLPAEPDTHPDPAGTPHATTEHLRRLWAAGGRDITVTYDEQVVRHRGYLANNRPDS